MGNAPPSKFVHRETADGEFVSFCQECLATVATSQWEAVLDQAELAHTCDPLELERLEELRQSLRRPAQSETSQGIAPGQSKAS
jgi:hypothetical protein